MKTLLLLSLAIPALSISCLAQPNETRKVTDKDLNEIYYVLQSDKSIKHGSYKKLNYKGSVSIIGYYKIGVKDSVWEFYDYDGKLEQKFNFTNNELVFYARDKKSINKKYKVISSSDPVEMNLDRPPLYIGGEEAVFGKLNRTISYPPKARENNTEGEVQIAFIIHKNGKTSDHQVIKGIGNGCDEEALKAVKQLPENWLPGLLNGEPVDVEFVIPIRFFLQ